MRRARGFTLIELMIAMAIIVVLSVLAISAYRRFTARARVTEVHAMFADIRAKEESYRAEFSSYLTISTAETDLYPALMAGSEPRPKTWAPPNAAWGYLGIRPPTPQVYCSYGVIAAPAGQWGAAGTYVRAFFGNAVPPVNWWAAMAMCDNDNVAGSYAAGDNRNAKFTTSSLNTSVREEDPVR